jgi:hypothetical protein
MGTGVPCSIPRREIALGSLNQRGVVTLDKKLFKRLVESMGQMDEIARGMRAPSREFYVEAAKVEADLERDSLPVNQ